MNAGRFPARTVRCVLALLGALALHACDAPGGTPDASVDATSHTDTHADDATLRAASAALTQSRSAAVAADTILESATPSSPAGSSATFTLGDAAATVVVAHVDPSVIAAESSGGVIDAAVLRYDIESCSIAASNTVTVSLHRMTTPWTEAGATWTCANDTVPGNATDDCAPADAWTPGGSTVPWGSTAVASVIVSDTCATELAFDVTTEVGAWPADGWALVATATTGDTLSLAARETTGIAPYLDLTVTWPDVETLCTDGLDDDLDGLVDCCDPDCAADPACPAGELLFGDHVDGDGDGFVDCSDAESCRATSPDCVGGIAPAGDPCTEHGVCSSDATDPYCVVESIWGVVGGACSEFCDPAASTCSTGLTCSPTPLATALGLCVETCTVDADCGTGTVCREVGAVADLVCIAPCTVDADCADPGALCQPSGLCAPAELCSSGFDEDLDGAIDCADSDCSGDPACTSPTEANCANGVDDDADGAIDCADADCAADAACVPPNETDCADTVDNDGDGLTDCADVDCDGAWGCPGPTELHCDDGVDNDGDGHVDCADPACSGGSACSPTVEAVCDDGVDNDSDGDIDCCDVDCATDAACSFDEGICDDYADNEPDGDLDCADPGFCQSCAAACVPGPTSHGAGCDEHSDCQATGNDPFCLSQSSHGVPGGQCTEFCDVALNDCPSGFTCLASDITTGQGLCGRACTASTDCAPGEMCGWAFGYSQTICRAACTSDFDCDTPDICDTAGWCVPPAEDCYSTGDEDGNGLADCDDPACQSTSSSCPPSFEYMCHDMYDDDLDGLTDCADPDCNGFEGCEGSSEICWDGIDNELDGLVDCNDPDCGSMWPCDGTAESWCGDGVDNDGDSAFDCDDSDCWRWGGCGMPSEWFCRDGVDNDADGTVDCDDGDCAGIDGCVPGSEMSCGDGLDDDADGSIDCDDADCADAKECGLHWDVQTLPANTLDVDTCGCDGIALSIPLPDASWSTIYLADLRVPSWMSDLRIESLQDGQVLSTWHLNQPGEWSDLLPGNKLRVAASPGGTSCSCDSSSSDNSLRIWAPTVRVGTEAVIEDLMTLDLPTPEVQSEAAFDGQFSFDFVFPSHGAVSVSLVAALDEAAPCSWALDISDNAGTPIVAATTGVGSNMARFDASDVEYLRGQLHGTCTEPALPILGFSLQGTFRALPAEGVHGLDNVSVRGLFAGGISFNGDHAAPGMLHNVLSASLQSSLPEAARWIRPTRVSEAACLPPSALQRFIEDDVCVAERLLVRSRDPLIISAVEGSTGRTISWVTHDGVLSHGYSVPFSPPSASSCHVSPTSPRLCERDLTSGELRPRSECGSDAIHNSDGDADALPDFNETCFTWTHVPPSDTVDRSVDGPRDTDGDGHSDGWEVCGTEVMDAHVYHGGPLCRDLLVDAIVVGEGANPSAASVESRVSLVQAADANARDDLARGAERVYIGTARIIRAATDELEANPTVHGEYLFARAIAWAQVRPRCDRCTTAPVAEHGARLSGELLPHPYDAYCESPPEHPVCIAGVTLQTDSSVRPRWTRPEGYVVSRDASGDCQCEYRTDLEVPCEGDIPGSVGMTSFLAPGSTCDWVDCDAGVEAGLTPDAQRCTLPSLADYAEVYGAWSAPGTSEIHPQLALMARLIFLKDLEACSQGRAQTHRLPPMVCVPGRMATRTYVHEFGHILGLGHSGVEEVPFEGRTARFGAGHGHRAEYASVMSYDYGEQLESGTSRVFFSDGGRSWDESFVDSESNPMNLAANSHRLLASGFYSDASRFDAASPLYGGSCSRTNPCPGSTTCVGIEPTAVNFYNRDSAAAPVLRGTCRPLTRDVDLNGNGFFDADLTRGAGETVGWNLDNDCRWNSTLGIWEMLTHGPIDGVPEDRPVYDLEVPFEACAIAVDEIFVSHCDSEDECSAGERCFGLVQCEPDVPSFFGRSVACTETVGYCTPDDGIGDRGRYLPPGVRIGDIFDGVPTICSTESGSEECRYLDDDGGQTSRWFGGQDLGQVLPHTERSDFDGFAFPNVGAEICGELPCDEPEPGRIERPSFSLESDATFRVHLCD